MTTAAPAAELAGRPIYRTVNVRAEDLRKGDVIRNAFGKWDRVKSAKPSANTGAETHVDVAFEIGGKVLTLRTVDLVALQIVKPS